MTPQESPLREQRAEDLAEGSTINILAVIHGLEVELASSKPRVDTPAADYFRNSDAVLVQGKTIRRHLYFNLPAAYRAVKRALTRGDKAELILVRLAPVDARHLDHGEACE